MPRPLRTSCDRCHSHKLKCPKQLGTSVCTRCMKIGAECTFSPAGANTRPMVQAVVATPPSAYDFSFTTPLMDDMGMQFDWTPPLSLHDTLPEPSEEQQQQQQQQQAAPPLPEAEDARSVCVQQLSSLAVDIEHVFSCIPTRPLIHVNKDRPIAEFTSEFLDKYIKQQALGKMFTHAQRLIDIYPQAMDLIFKTPEDEDDVCQDPDCIHHQDMPVDFFRVLAADVHKRVPIDTFLFNLLVACHSRLSEIFGTLLTHVKTCAKVTMATKDDAAPPWSVTLPKLTVGNFVAPPKTSSTMQAVLIVHIASVLAKRAKGLAERLTQATQAMASEKKIRMLILQCEVLAEEAETRTRELREVQDRMMRIEFSR